MNHITLIAGTAKFMKIALLSMLTADSMYATVWYIPDSITIGL